MPSTLHEEPFDYLKAYCGTVSDPQYDANMMIALTLIDRPTDVVMISGLGECVQSEDKDHTFNKMEAEIKSHPETMFTVIMIKREDGYLINIHNNDSSYMAYGENEGLHGGLSKEISPGWDCSKLVEADVAFPILWHLAIKGILSAADVTAYQHYQTWHMSTFRGTKHNHNDLYCPSELESGKGSSQLEELETSLPKLSEGKVITPLPQPDKVKDINTPLKSTEGEGINTLSKPTTRSKGVVKHTKA
ncbi:hypothetical protein BD769DRAFT_1390554 [Suillus cothurnatus]|nr:hypothetical protein BD769DRAFT_1390554 [Suillus cothurnatus]